MSDQKQHLYATKPPLITVAGKMRPEDGIVLHDQGLPIGVFRVDKITDRVAHTRFTWFHAQLDSALLKSFKRDYPMVSLDNFD